MDCNACLSAETAVLLMTDGCVVFHIRMDTSVSDSALVWLPLLHVRQGGSGPVVLVGRVLHPSYRAADCHPDSVRLPSARTAWHVAPSYAPG